MRLNRFQTLVFLAVIVFLLMIVFAGYSDALIRFYPSTLGLSSTLSTGRQVLTTHDNKNGNYASLNPVKLFLIKLKKLSQVTPDLTATAKPVHQNIGFTLFFIAFFAIFYQMARTSPDKDAAYYGRLSKIFK